MIKSSILAFETCQIVKDPNKSASCQCLRRLSIWKFGNYLRRLILKTPNPIHYFKWLVLCCYKTHSQALLRPSTLNSHLNHTSKSL